MTLTPVQQDRVRGVLVGQAVGDALGVPYEFESRRLTGDPGMLGGGLGNYRPGEWSDDTQMAICIAEVAATGADLTSEEALDAIAARFEEWYADGPADIGNQTRAVLGLACRLDGSSAARLRQASRQVHERSGRSAGNGSIMRTSPVALAHLSDRDAAVEAARLISELTHFDPLAGDAAALWTDLIRRAVISGSPLKLDLSVVPGERRDYWAELVADAEAGPPSRFTPNGSAMAALQAAWSAIVSTRSEHGDEGAFSDSVFAAIRIGNDTDTVAAIAGGAVGAVHGLSAIREDWVSALNGWPGLRGADLIEMVGSIIR